MNDLLFLMRVLEASKRFTVEVVYTARAAQEALRRTKFRAMLMNLKLPDMDGYQLIQHAKQNHPAMPICVITGLDDERARARIRDAGAIAIFNKPYNSVDNQALLNMLDVTDAAYSKGKAHRSWRTSACGAIALVGSFIALCSTSPPELDKFARDLATVFLALGLFYARDQKAAAARLLEEET